ncbi:ThiF family adenylyltransferase [Sabulicella glaciei]|uniref:ThiF family adenylyltransferase n=1 Tax=Sabulicella glaciei TaxID=2984948 RepID=A0ABT3NZX6_9PROT|nr:ThiF family adenylyltransferase [Roseococcus sp. MDT2-1-1]MCW8087711.1 ThiF family adenylyltransferase [Roseococcus sp. MDT2-1-1]
MTVDSWLSTFSETFDGSGFRIAEARAVAEFMRRYGAPAGSFVEGRRRGDQELVILDLLTAAPQRPVYPIRPAERIGILFARENAQPFVTMLRDDFPDTEHQQLVPEGMPAAICIDDRPWAEARLTWTPAELVERVLKWFRRAGRGELHDARQPLDPVLIGSQLSFFIAGSVLDAGTPQDLIAEHDPGDGTILCVRPAQQGKLGSAEPFSIATYKVPGERMKRLTFAPHTLASLGAMLAERGIDLFADLRTRLGGWIAEGPAAAWRLNGRFAVIVEMPIVSPRGVQQDGLDHRAFVTAHSAGDIAVALGIAQQSMGMGAVGYVKRFGAAAPDETAIAAIEVQSAEVYLAFEPDFAARLAGRSAPDDRSVVLVGAGAIGSHVADDLAREGRFRWTVIDDDRLLPHNLARHVARGDAVTRPKARILADHINLTLTGPARASAIAANLFANGDDSAAIEEALRSADIVIDATASVLAARHLSDHQTQARRACVFFNPAGTGAVLLAEPADRALTLRDLEAQYHGLVLRTERLADHLGQPAETVAYTGACRAITNRIPQSRASILSGLAGSGLAAAIDSEAAVVCIWSLTPDGGVTVDTTAPQTVTRFRAGEWEIAFDAGLVARLHEMRDARLPSETGGVLFGIVDIPAKHIHIVEASAAPPDSTEQPGSFVRGVAGVEEMMESVRRRTAGQVRYVGEWHSHPPRSSARPSAVDGEQIDWLAALMGMDSMPALMVIAAERELAVIFADQHAEPLPPLCVDAARRER